MMRTLDDIDLLTAQQLEFLCAISDGGWYDRKSIRKKMGMKKLIPSILSERVIKPLEAKGIIEQEERPLKDGSRKMKKVTRIREDIDLLLLMNLRDSYQTLLKNSNEKQDKRGEMLYQKAYEALDNLCQSHFVIGGTSLSLSPGEAELYRIAHKIEKYCKTYEQAIAAACIARPDLYKEHQEWQSKYGPKGRRLPEVDPTEYDRIRRELNARNGGD